MPGLGAVLDLSSEDITSLDDAAVASLLEEALAEAQVPSRKPRAVEQTRGADRPDETTPTKSADELDLDLNLSLSADGEDGLDLAALGLTELAGGGAMLSDEDADLAFPDELYEDDDEETADAIIEELRRSGEALHEENDALRKRVEELTRADREAMFDRLRLKDENSTLSAQIGVYRDRLLNIQESLDLHRDRMAKERDKGIRREKERVLRAMLPVVDHMELALHHARNGESGSALVEGFALILEQFQRALAEQGVGRIEAERGLPFDPSLHDAVMREETDELPPSSITQVLRTGYTLGDRLLRAARVAVTPAPEKEPEPDLEPEPEPVEEEVPDVDDDRETEDSDAEDDKRDEDEDEEAHDSPDGDEEPPPEEDEDE